MGPQQQPDCSDSTGKCYKANRPADEFLYAPSSGSQKGSQGCGNTMPDLSNLVPFHSEQVKKIFTCPGTSKNKINAILHFMVSVVECLARD